MKIGHKICVIIFIVFAIVICMAIAAQKYVVSPGFEEIEKWFIRNEIGWINDLVNRESDRIDALCTDWANWDDTYQYVSEHNQDYETTNLSANVLKNNFLNFIAIVDNDGQVVVARSYNVITDEIIDVIFPEFDNTRLPEDCPLLVKSETGKISGIAQSTKGPAFITAHPVLKTNGQGPANGTIIMARIFDKQFLGDIFSNAGHTVEVIEENLADCGPEDFKDTLVANYPGGSYSVCKVIDTVYGDTDYILQLITPDYVGRHNKKYDYIILASIVIIGLFGLLLMITVVMRVIITPIKKLDNHLCTIAETKNLDIIPIGEAKDEISSLAHRFNQLLRQIKEDQLVRDQINLKLQESNNNLRQFAHSVSHDLKEPLRTITSYLQLIEVTSPPSGETAEFMGYVVDASRRMYNMINDLLDYSKSSSMDYPLRDCDTKVITQNIVRELSLMINETSAVIEIGDLPTVKGYAPLLCQIFRNLILNAIKYRRKDIAPHIIVDCRTIKGVKTFFVKDNGKGIDKQYHTKIFEIFQRLEHNDKSGTGLGLAICQKVAQRHNGQIWVESQEDTGSTFYFTIKTE